MGDRICGECEFFGKYQSIILSQFKECVADGRVTYTRDFLGFDKKMGASCDNKDHRPTNVRVNRGIHAKHRLGKRMVVTMW